MSAVDASGMQTPLLTGETLLDSWRPQLALFLQRSGLLSFTTALVLASLGYLSFWQWLVAVPVFTVLFIFIFDDHVTWYRHRDENWYLTTRRLVFETPGSPQDNAAVPLQAIEWMRPWFWWTLRLGFEGGTATAIRFVARPRNIRRQIIQAQSALGPSPAEKAVQ